MVVGGVNDQNWKSWQSVVLNTQELWQLGIHYELHILLNAPLPGLIPLPPLKSEP